jgi:acyl-coenzyme A synthetase/AMP-(fatty) acid ligase
MPEPALPEPQPFWLLAHHARRSPDAVALSSYARDYSYLEVHDYATSIAGLLRRRGVRPGQLVLANLRNELNLLFMEAVYHEAAIWASYAGELGEREPVAIDWLLSHEPVDSFPSERTVVIDEAFVAEVARGEHRDAPLAYESFDSVCRVSFSSGTTGRPMAVGSSVARQARPAQGWLETRPFFSLIGGFTGSGVKTANAMIAGGDTYICPGEPGQNVELAQRNFVAALQGSPAQLTEFLDLLARREDRHHDIVDVQYIGSFLSEHLLGRLRDELGAAVTACYGSSEMGMITQRRDVRERPNDVGAALPGITIEIVDDQDRLQPTGVEGAIRVRTSRRAAGYLGGADARGALRDGWFYPGDLGSLSSEGHLVLSGRASEVINAGGVKFHPDAVEGVLARVPGVRDAALVAHTGADGFSGYAAAVVVEDGFELASLIEPLTAACAGVPPSSIFRVGAIDRDPNGKVRRRELAARLTAAKPG